MPPYAWPTAPPMGGPPSEAKLKRTVDSLMALGIEGARDDITHDVYHVLAAPPPSLQNGFPELSSEARRLVAACSKKQIQLDRERVELHRQQAELDEHKREVLGRQKELDKQQKRIHKFQKWFLQVDAIECLREECFFDRETEWNDPTLAPAVRSDQDDPAEHPMDSCPDSPTSSLFNEDGSAFKSIYNGDDSDHTCAATNLEWEDPTTMGPQSEHHQATSVHAVSSLVNKDKPSNKPIYEWDDSGHSYNVTNPAREDPHVSAYHSGLSTRDEDIVPRGLPVSPLINMVKSSNKSVYNGDMSDNLDATLNLEWNDPTVPGSQSGPFNRYQATPVSGRSVSSRLAEFCRAYEAAKIQRPEATAPIPSRHPERFASIYPPDLFLEYFDVFLEEYFAGPRPIDGFFYRAADSDHDNGRGKSTTQSNHTAAVPVTHADAGASAIGDTPTVTEHKPLAMNRHKKATGTSIVDFGILAASAKSPAVTKAGMHTRKKATATDTDPWKTLAAHSTSSDTDVEYRVKGTFPAARSPDTWASLDAHTQGSMGSGKKDMTTSNDSWETPPVYSTSSETGKESRKKPTMAAAISPATSAVGVSASIQTSMGARRKSRFQPARVDSDDGEYEVVSDNEAQESEW